MFPADHHVLVYWPEENAVTAVLIVDVKSPAPSELHPGVVCTVKYRSRVYDGTVAAIGMYMYRTRIYMYVYIIMYTQYTTTRSLFVVYVYTGCKKEMLELSKQFENGEWSPPTCSPELQDNSCANGKTAVI